MKCGLHGLSQSQTKDYFPWYLLPRELQVKILRNLCRRDVDSCRLLNRDMFELIRCNERWMKRRFIEKVEIQTMYDSTIHLEVYCHEDGIKKTLHIRQAPNSGTNFERCLLRIFRNADVDELMLSKEYLTDSILHTVCANLQHTGSKILSLWITEIPRHHVTSAALLQLLRVADPMEIILDGFFPRDDSTADLIQFIVKRLDRGERIYCVSKLYGKLVLIDGDVLANFTAGSLYICAPNAVVSMEKILKVACRY